MHMKIITPTSPIIRIPTHTIHIQMLSKKNECPQILTLEFSLKIETNIIFLDV